MEKLTFEEFRREVEDLKKIGEGWRGVVYRGKWKGEVIALKVAKRKEALQAIRKEGEILEKLRGIDGFPQILVRGVDFVAYRFIERFT